MPDANITKSALAASMKKLMMEKPFDKISVIDICRGCGMNRKSFYYHFKDKYDLVNWIFYMDFITMMTSHSYTVGWELLGAVAEMFYKNQDFYRAAFRIEGQNSFREYLNESMIPIASFYLSDISEDPEDEELFMAMFCEAYISIVEHWLQKGCRQTPDEFAGRLHAMVRGIARKVVESEEIVTELYRKK